MRYTEAKLRQVSDANSIRIYGERLEADFGGGHDETRVRKNGNWIPVHVCFCVWSSPQSPCPCDLHPPIWWLPESGVVAHGESERKDQRGNTLSYFDVRNDATVLVESIQPVKAGALKAISLNSTPSDLLRLGIGPVEPPLPGYI